LKKKGIFITLVLVIGLMGTWSWAEPSGVTTPTAADVIKQIQKTYGGGSFSAAFEQTSTLKAMDITDTASGRAYFLEPGMMRWEYTAPEPQQIITNGTKLWIYKPLEHQVMVGDAPALFGDGQGVNFLAAISTIEEKSSVTIDPERTGQDVLALKLVPNSRTADLAVIYIYVLKKSGLIQAIETINTYEDSTRIVFSDIRLGDKIDPALFSFEPPSDADIMVIDQPN